MEEERWTLVLEEGVVLEVEENSWLELLTVPEVLQEKTMHLHRYTESLNVHAGHHISLVE